MPAVLGMLVIMLGSDENEFYGRQGPWCFIAVQFMQWRFLFLNVPWLLTLGFGLYAYRASAAAAQRRLLQTFEDAYSDPPSVADLQTQLCLRGLLITTAVTM